MRVHSVYAWKKKLDSKSLVYVGVVNSNPIEIHKVWFFSLLTPYHTIECSIKTVRSVLWCCQIFFISFFLIRSNIEEKYLVISVKIFIIDSIWPLVSQLRCNAHAFVDQVPDWMYLWRIIIQNVRKLWTEDKKQKSQMTRQDERKKHTYQINTLKITQWHICS